MGKNHQNEKLLNVPNTLTFIRVLLTLVLIWMFILEFEVMTILIVFIIAALTDFLDGQVARRFDQVTRFGAKFDVIADRILWITVGIMILATFYSRGVFLDYHVYLMVLALTREIICFPFTLIFLLMGKKVIFQAEISGKVTTFVQGFSFPLIILHSLGYTLGNLALYFSILTCISGIWASKDYIQKLFDPKAV